MPHITALIPAAGQGTRMGSTINKQLMLLGGKPLLIRTLEIFQHCDPVDNIVLVAAAGEEENLRQLSGKYRITKVTDVVTGGQERQDSVARGLEALPPETDLVAVHDGARPLLLFNNLLEVLGAAEKTGAAVLAMPVKDTLKVVNERGRVLETPDRSTLWAVQTPQVFRRDIIKAAYEKANGEGYTGTDDASLVERWGFPVQVVRGSYENIKITTPDDLELAELLLRRRG